jgi:hypothetical protein
MIDDASPYQGFPSKIKRPMLPFYSRLVQDKGIFEKEKSSSKSKGKCYSMVDRGQRKASDRYETPFSLLRTFISIGWADPNMTTLEPMCGNGAIVKVLQEYDFKRISSYDIETGTNFLEETKQYEQIITNPAFSIAHETILKCKEVATEQFALLLPLTYLQGVNRYRDTWMDKSYPLECIYVFNRYPLLGEPLREDGKFHTGMMSLAFFCWRKRYYSEPIIRWLDIDKYVLKKGE